MKIRFRSLLHAAPAVAFTIDDGYLDHAKVAAPIFAEFDCPVTTFVTTGFLDGQLWLWWDRIQYVFENTPRTSVTLSPSGVRLTYSWRDALQKTRAEEDFVARCKKIPDIDTVEAFRAANPDHIIVTFRGVGEMQPDNPNSRISLGNETDEFGEARAFISLGNASVEQAEHTMRLADKHKALGFHLAPLRSFGRRLGVDTRTAGERRYAA